MGKKISDERKAAYYIGMGISILGFILFISNFFIAASNFGNFNNFESRGQAMMFRAIGGMVLIIIGQVIASIGAKGLAGSGIKLDPEQARKDLEPYSRMAGGMVKDALEEADINLGGGRSERIIMIKCRGCSKLNEEDSKFCQECAAPI
ncbi:MAG: zinc ribbon domain-containing protein [Lentisphaeraceae bacterium]|nr:zinc ribbon domain-containing protein [Lentisphaeraceae bacterium]